MMSPSEQLQQLMARLDGQGFETRIISGRLFVIAAPCVEGDGSRLVDVIAATSRPNEQGFMAYNGERRRTEVITCEPRGDDGDQLWFFDASGTPVDEASHVIDASLMIGSRVERSRAAR